MKSSEFLHRMAGRSRPLLPFGAFVIDDDMLGSGKHLLQGISDLSQGFTGWPREEPLNSDSRVDQRGSSLHCGTHRCGKPAYRSDAV